MMKPASVAPPIHDGHDLEYAGRHDGAEEEYAAEPEDQRRIDYELQDFFHLDFGFRISGCGISTVGITVKLGPYIGHSDALKDLTQKLLRLGSLLQGRGVSGIHHHTMGEHVCSQGFEVLGCAKGASFKEGKAWAAR